MRTTAGCAWARVLFSTWPYLSELFFHALLHRGLLSSSGFLPWPKFFKPNSRAQEKKTSLPLWTNKLTYLGDLGGSNSLGMWAQTPPSLQLIFAHIEESNALAFLSPRVFPTIAFTSLDCITRNGREFTLKPWTLNVWTATAKERAAGKIKPSLGGSTVSEEQTAENLSCPTRPGALGAPQTIINSLY